MVEDLGEELKRNIPLSEMIATLRQELKVAFQEGEGETLRFDVKRIHLELQVSVEKERGREGKISFWVIDAGAKSSAKQQDTHVFKLEIEPTWMVSDGQGGRKREPLDLAGSTSGRPKQY
jgi:hypothetical protein